MPETITVYRYNELSDDEKQRARQTVNRSDTFIDTDVRYQFEKLREELKRKYDLEFSYEFKNNYHQDTRILGTATIRIDKENFIKKEAVILDDIRYPMWQIDENDFKINEENYSIILNTINETNKTLQEIINAANEVIKPAVDQEIEIRNRLEDGEITEEEYQDEMKKLRNETIGKIAGVIDTKYALAINEDLNEYIDKVLTEDSENEIPYLFCKEKELPYHISLFF